MLSSRLRTDIRGLWDRFWSGGIANPLTAIEQINYLIFLKQLEHLDDQYAQAAQDGGRPYHSIFDVPNGETYRWQYLYHLPSEERLQHMRGNVFNWLKTIEGAEERMRDAVFVIPSANLLQGAVAIIENLYVPSRNQDALGDVYEYLLSEIAEAGKNGQFRTPRHIIRAMCDLVDPQPNEHICDPACGTGGFLVNAYQHILKSYTSDDILQFEADGTALNLIGDTFTREEHEGLRHNHFYGFDFDRTMVRLGWMNLLQHGLVNPQVTYADTLGSLFNKRLRVSGGDVGDFDVVLANPPFKGNIDKSDIGESLRWLGTTKTELLFVELILQLLRIGGRAAVIVPEGVLFGSTSAHLALRTKLVNENQLNAVISLPAGVFEPYSGVKTSILVFTRGGHTNEVWFYEVKSDGFTLSAKRDEQPERNDLWDMTLKYRLRNMRAFRRPRPAFVSGDAWKEWQGLNEPELRESCAQPVIVKRPIEDSEGERIEAKLFDHVERRKCEDEKTLVISLGEVRENSFNLGAGRYRLFEPQDQTVRDPLELIEELFSLEKNIEEGLQTLHSLIRGEE